MLLKKISSLKKRGTIRGVSILRLAKIPTLYHDWLGSLNYLSCIEGKGRLKDSHCIAQNAALFVDRLYVKYIFLQLFIIFTIEKSKNFMIKRAVNFDTLAGGFYNLKGLLFYHLVFIDFIITHIAINMFILLFNCNHFYFYNWHIKKVGGTVDKKYYCYHQNAK